MNVGGAGTTAESEQFQNVLKKTIQLALTDLSATEVNSVNSETMFQFYTLT